MPKKVKRGRKKVKKRTVKNSIYKSNVNKQNVKVHIINPSSGSGSSGVHYMNTPSYPSSASNYPNLMDLNSTIKGTVEELLKKHQQQTTQHHPKPIIPPTRTININGNEFENQNQNPRLMSLTTILQKHKTKEDQDSETKEDQDPKNLFENYENGTPMKYETKSEEPLQIPFKYETQSEDPLKTIWPDISKKKAEEKQQKPSAKEERKEIKNVFEVKFPEDSPFKTKTG